MKCRVCGKSIIIFCSNDGAVHILDKSYHGFADAHLCGSYEQMLSKYMIKKLEIEEE